MPINIVDLSSVDIIKFSELSVTFNDNDLTDNFLIAIESISGDTGNLRIGDLKSFVFENSELTGTPTAPTAIQGTNTDQLATCSFVLTELAGAGLNPATTTEFGSVKTDQNDANPVVYLSSSVDALLNDFYTISQTNALLDDKADSTQLANYYTITQTDNLLNQKANVTLLSSYLPLTGGVITGNLEIGSSGSGYGFDSNGNLGAEVADIGTANITNLNFSGDLTAGTRFRVERYIDLGFDRNVIENKRISFYPINDNTLYSYLDAASSRIQLNSVLGDVELDSNEKIKLVGRSSSSGGPGITVDNPGNNFSGTNGIYYKGFYGENGERGVRFGAETGVGTHLGTARQGNLNSSTNGLIQTSPASDLRIKENIKKVDNPSILDAFINIDPVIFDYKDFDEFDVKSKNNIGLLAQQVEKYLPFITYESIKKLDETQVSDYEKAGFTIYKNPDGKPYVKIKGVKYEKIQTLSISAIKVLVQEISELKERIKTLESFYSLEN